MYQLFLVSLLIGFVYSSDQGCNSYSAVPVDVCYVFDTYSTIYECNGTDTVSITIYNSDDCQGDVVGTPTTIANDDCDNDDNCGYLTFTCSSYTYGYVVGICYTSGSYSYQTTCDTDGVLTSTYYDSSDCSGSTYGTPTTNDWVDYYCGTNDVTVM